MSPPSEEFKRVYLKNLPSRIRTLESHLEYVKAQRPDAVKKARVFAHALAGSGGTYGFPQVSILARQTEKSSEESFLEKAGELLALLKEIVGKEAREFNLLIVEDDPDISEVLRSKLGKPGRNVFVCSNAQEAEDALQGNPIDFIITDLTLPDLDGRNLIRKMRRVREMAGVPIYVLTGMDVPLIRLECLALGASGFFTKPFDPDRFAEEVESKIRESCQTFPSLGQDSLTGLPDRHSLKIQFEKALANLAKNQSPSCLALLNFDLFSKVNEKHGRSIGDQILARVGTDLSKLSSGIAFVSRLGGDNLALLIEGLDIENAQSFVESAAKEIGEIRFEIGDREAVSVSLSGGIVQIQNRMDLEEALNACERLLYKAKGAGRGRIFSEKTPAASAKIMKVLVADDDDLIGSLVRHRLGNEGFDVQWLADGKQAFQAARENSFSLFILDIQMPGMDGFELLSRLRSLPEYSRTPMIVLTSMGSEKDIVRGFELGADDYLVKPFSPGELVARSLRLLKGLK